MRIGIGHDTHRLGPGGPLRIGGVTVDHDHHLIGHSDADVVLHAVTDALLGAIASEDIGDLFPNSEDQNRGRDSSEFVRAAHQRVTEAGYRVGNVDCIIFAQRPQLSAVKPAIRQCLAEMLGVATEAVSVKAKTGEAVGPIGREEAISAECVVLLKPQTV